jgi:hypothetical protein
MSVVLSNMAAISGGGRGLIIGHPPPALQTADGPPAIPQAVEAGEKG